MFENTLYPGIATALTRIRATGFRIFLATSKPKVFAAQILDHFDLTQFFHTVHGSELDGRRSDKGELVAHILATERLDPESTLIVGDRFHDVAGGKKNAIMTAAVTYGYGSREELVDSQPDIMVDSPEELILFLEANGAVAKGGYADRLRYTGPGIRQASPGSSPGRQGITASMFRRR